MLVVNTLRGETTDDAIHDGAEVSLREERLKVDLVLESKVRPSSRYDLA